MPPPEQIDWYKETYFYILDVNGMVKIGITSNWGRRMASYEREFPKMPIVKLKQELYEYWWQAELLEQVMKWRLRPWVVYGRHEYIKNLPIQVVLNCHLQTRDLLKPEFLKLEYIHKRGNERWDFYRQLAESQFDNRILG